LRDKFIQDSDIAIASEMALCYIDCSLFFAGKTDGHFF
jgi:hypothetical protein